MHPPSVHGSQLPLLEMGHGQGHCGAFGLVGMTSDPWLLLWCLAGLASSRSFCSLAAKTGWADSQGAPGKGTELSILRWHHPAQESLLSSGTIQGIRLPGSHGPPTV